MKEALGKRDISHFKKNYSLVETFHFQVVKIGKEAFEEKK
jgi:hypothetical protein